MKRQPKVLADGDQSARQKASGVPLAPGDEDGRILVTRRGLAVALGVSLRTVERMLHDEEIEPVRLRGSVRFLVPDVVQRLVESAATRKNGRKAAVAPQYPRRAE